MGGTPPYTHEENLASARRDVPLVFENVRKPEQASTIARCAFREYNNGTPCPFPHFFQTLGPLLAVGGLDGDSPSVGEYGPE